MAICCTPYFSSVSHNSSQHFEGYRPAAAQFRNHCDLEVGISKYTNLNYKIRTVFCAMMREATGPKWAILPLQPSVILVGVL